MKNSKKQCGGFIQEAFVWNCISFCIKLGLDITFWDYISETLIDFSSLMMDPNKIRYIVMLLHKNKHAKDKESQVIKTMNLFIMEVILFNLIKYITNNIIVRDFILHFRFINPKGKNKYYLQINPIHSSEDKIKEINNNLKKFTKFLGKSSDESGILSRDLVNIQENVRAKRDEQSFLQLPFDTVFVYKHSEIFNEAAFIDQYAFVYKLDDEKIKFLIEPSFNSQEEKCMFNSIIKFLLMNERSLESNQQTEIENDSVKEDIQSEDPSFNQEINFEVS